VRHIKDWVEVAARLGAPVIRVFADTQMRSQTWETVAKGYTRDQVQEWIAAALRECADHGKKYGVRIGVQNHGDFLKTGRELLGLVKAVGSDWCGPIVDTGYFKTSDPYADIALVAPHALNWQIKQSVRRGERGPDRQRSPRRSPPRQHDRDVVGETPVSRPGAKLLDDPFDDPLRLERSAPGHDSRQPLFAEFFVPVGRACFHHPVAIEDQKVARVKPDRLVRKCRAREKAQHHSSLFQALDAAVRSDQ
jgi:sugar phosphate isomerase/epimerase